MGTYLILCTRHPLLHSQQHLGTDVCQDGCSQWGDGFVYEFAVSTLDHQALLEPVHRHHQDQTMVDHLYANPDVNSIHPVDTVYSETG